MQWLEQLNIQRLIGLLVHVLALCCGLLLGALGWKVYMLATDQGITMPSVDFSDVPPPQNPGWGRWVDLMVSIPPLETTTKKPKQTTQAPKPITTQIALEGIIGVGQAGVAIMRVDNGKEAVYYQGDEVVAGVVLTSIDVNSISLSNGVNERQYFFPESVGLSRLLEVQNTTSSLLEPIPKESPISRVTKATPKPILPQKQQQVQQRTPVKVIAPEVVQTLQEVREKPLMAASFGDVRFVQQNGQMLGLQVRNFRNPALFAAIGLQPNDTVLRVNGTSVVDLASNPVLVQQFLQQEHFVIDILRGGVSKTINFTWPR